MSNGEYKFDAIAGTLTAEFHSIGIQCVAPPKPNQPISKNLLTEDQLTTIGKLLDVNRNIIPHISQDLIAEGLELSKVHGNHRLGLVTLGSGFETWVQFMLLCEYRARGITHNQHKPNIKIEDLLPEEQVSKLLDRHLKSLTSVDTKTEAAYTGWKTDAYEPRNQIIHRGRQNITEADLEKAKDAIYKMMNRIEELLRTSRPAGAANPNIPF